MDSAGARSIARIASEKIVLRKILKKSLVNSRQEKKWWGLLGDVSYRLSKISGILGVFCRHLSRGGGLNGLFAIFNVDADLLDSLRDSL